MYVRLRRRGACLLVIGMPLPRMVVVEAARTQATAVRHKRKPIHIPLGMKRQLPWKRRAVGAAVAGASLFFRPKTSTVGCLPRFSGG